MNDLAKQVWDDASALARAQIELAETIEKAPRMVYLLWQDTTLLGVCGTEARANQEVSEYNHLRNEAGCESVVIRIEKRVVFS